MGQLQPLNLVDFTGGLHLRRNEFNIADNQSPEMLNVEVDPRGGFFTRRGWTRWNTTDIVGTPTSINWAPRNAYIHPLADGSFYVFIANGSTIYASGTGASFSDQTITVSADPHLADFTSWGDTCYIATGLDNVSYKKAGTSAVASLTPPEDDGTSTWNDDYTTPVGGCMPRAELVEAHQGYLFCAGVKEDFDNTGAAEYPNRLRWSHFNEPEDWAQLDFQDIKIGGGKITGLKSFGDVLIIFKTDSVWGLFGYNADSWQYNQISANTGAPSPAAITRSPNAVYYYSGASRGGVYAIAGDGEPVHISDPLEQALDEMTDHDDTWLAWMNRKLWCCLPWSYALSSAGSSVFVFDPEVGEGAWTCHQPAAGELRCPIEGSDIIANKPFAVIEGSSAAAAVMEMEAQAAAVDTLGAGISPVPLEFSTLYRTGWKHGGWPELRKSWLRPRFIVGLTTADTQIDVDTFWDYDESAPRRSHRLVVEGETVPLWDALGSGGSGFDWGDGTLWGANVQGAQIVRTLSGGHMGHCAAVSMEFSTNAATPGVAWSVSGVVLKYSVRRFTT